MQPPLSPLIPAAPHRSVVLALWVKDGFHLPPACVSLPLLLLSPFSHIRLFVILWTIAHQAPLTMGFSRREHWSGLPCPPPGHLPNPGIKPTSLLSPALTGEFFTTSAAWKA